MIRLGSLSASNAAWKAPRPTTTNYEEKINDMSHEVHQLEEKLSTLRDNEGQQQALSDMQEKYTALTASMKSKEDEADNEMRKVRADLDKLSTDVSIKTKALEGFVPKPNKADANLVTANSERDAAKSALTTLQGDYETAQEQITS